MHKRYGERLTGIVMMVVTALLFSAMALFVRLAARTTPVGTIVLVRYFLSTLFIGALWAAGAVSVRPVNKRLLFMRATAASFGGLFYFFAVATITLGEAVILKYTYPFFAVSIAALMYGEKTDRSVIGLLVMSVAGVVVMMNPAAFHPQAGYAWGLLNGVSAGAAVAFLRRLRDTDNSATIMFFTSLAGVIVSLPFLAGGLGITWGADFYYMLLASLCGVAAQYALVYGMRYIKTGSACIIMALEVAMSAALGFVVLGHTLGLSKILGGALILTGGAVLILRESTLAKPQAPTVPDNNTAGINPQ
jgi:drug/metabolite transporter (DMT)-like permease